MKKLLFILFCLSLVGSSLCFADNEEYYTDGQGNGRLWQNIEDGQAKIYYLKGIEEGILLQTKNSFNQAMADYLVSDREIYEKINNTLNKAYEMLTVKGYRLSEIASMIDDFYEDKANIKIPISDAYEYTIYKLQGATPEELEKFLSACRMALK
ncbi:MAG: hypothetical protein ISS45_07835 [Candidatus Omnitrophica bacterium]|nr:hypothetical protein [Candidatus Omnitrophota bacterium]